MIPFEEGFYIDELKKYYDKLNGSEVNGKTIREKFLSKLEGYLFLEDKLCYSDDKIKKLELSYNGKVYMELSPKEVQGAFEAIRKVKGKVGIVGLGMGYFLQEIVNKEDVEEVIVYEIDEDIINLYEANFGKNEKVTIINIDAFKAEKDFFDYFFVDIYGYELSEDVVEHYIKFNEIHNIENYLFWGMEHFLLSCRIEQIAWIYIPELWMDMAKDLFERFNDSKYIGYFKALDEKLVENILDKFSKVL